MSSDAAIPLSIPLNKCNHGTTLQVSHTTEVISLLTGCRKQEGVSFLFHDVSFWIKFIVDFSEIKGTNRTRNLDFFFF